MTLNQGHRPDEQILNIGTMYLITDLQKGAKELFADLAKTSSAQAEVVRFHSDLLSKQRVKP